MIPDFRTYIGESIWADIHRRSNGEQVRKEDDVDLLDIEDFCDYLKSKYEVFGIMGGNIEYENPMTIIVPIMSRKQNSAFCFNLVYRIGNVILNKAIATENIFSKIYGKLKEEYRIDTYSDNMIQIFPKEGEETNSFFLNVIDFIIDNANKNNLILKRK